MMRRRALGSLIIGLTLAATSSPLWAEADVTLRIADQKGGMRAVLEAANQLQGLGYQIKWHEFPAAAPLAEALNAGAVDAGIIGDAPLLFVLAQGAPVKAIAVDKYDPYGTALLVRPDSPLTGAASLKGKTIATGRGSIGHFIALRALEQAGVAPTEVKWRFLAPADARIALLNKDVDVWATWEPYTTGLTGTGQGKVLVNGRGHIQGNTFLAATEDVLADPRRRAALQDYLARLAKAENWARDHTQAYGATLSKLIGLPPAIATAQYESRNARWQRIDAATITQQQQTADYWLKQGMILKPLDVKPTFDARFTLSAP
jgi:sulfonate transport system substrate-binding protein